MLMLNSDSQLHRPKARSKGSVNVLKCFNRFCVRACVHQSLDNSRETAKAAKPFTLFIYAGGNPMDFRFQIDDRNLAFYADQAIKSYMRLVKIRQLRSDEFGCPGEEIGALRTSQSGA
jgi:hypothetical protein